jgi:cytidyltransferase-like protein
MNTSIPEIIRKIHDSPVRIVLAISGGGTEAISAIAKIPGASRTLIEAIVPYSADAMTQWLGGRPDQFCAPSTTRRMGMAALFRAEELSDVTTSRAGIACTASLATDRPKLGMHRVYVSIQTIDLTASQSLLLEKGKRNREQEEELVTKFILNSVAEACGLEDRLELELTENERIECSRTEAPQLWQELLRGKIEALCHPVSGIPAPQEQTPSMEPPTLGREKPVPKAVFPGAFNPVHAGHMEMVEAAQKLLDCSVEMEISIQNPDKPPLDYETIRRRVEQFTGKMPVWLTRAATFEEKSKLFPGAVFIVGADTIRRIAEPRYYGGEAGCLAALEKIASRGCRFLVFGRDSGTGFANLGHFDLPLVLRSICQEVPAETFRRDVSSTAIRRAKDWKELGM